MDSPDSEDVVSARESLSSEERSPYVEYSTGVMNSWKEMLGQEEVRS